MDTSNLQGDGPSKIHSGDKRGQIAVKKLSRWAQKAIRAIALGDMETAIHALNKEALRIRMFNVISGRGFGSICRNGHRIIPGRVKIKRSSLNGRKYLSCLDCAAAAARRYRRRKRDE